MRKEEYADSDLDALDEFEDKELLNLGPWALGYAGGQHRFAEQQLYAWKAM